MKTQKKRSRCSIGKLLFQVPDAENNSAYAQLLRSELLGIREEKGEKLGEVWWGVSLEVYRSCLGVFFFFFLLFWLAFIVHLVKGMSYYFGWSLLLLAANHANPCWLFGWCLLFLALQKLGLLEGSKMFGTKRSLGNHLFWRNQSTLAWGFSFAQTSVFRFPPVESTEPQGAMCQDVYDLRGIVFWG